jgi:polyisoprenoid-binding protein YceI
MFKKVFLSFFVMVISALLMVRIGYASEYVIDKQQSQMFFKINYAVGAVGGQFSNYSGNVSFDDVKGRIKKVTTVLKVDSVDTLSDKRDEALRSVEWFDAASFPEIRFESSKISKTKISGKFTMHGVTKNLSLNYTFEGKSKDSFGRDIITFKARTMFKRKDYGMTHNIKLANGTYLISEEVELHIKVVAVGQ